MTEKEAVTMHDILDAQWLYDNHKDENDKKINIFFHTDDVKVFKKDIREYGKPAKQILPVRQ